ncbi:hypothetical protein WGM54_14160 [Paenibacillus polymyxa]|uniref:hypothetical protein n=1 Tax=Paenibacillus polymyxa TaxID=1406 RepID=UPI00307E0ABE
MKVVFNWEQMYKERGDLIRLKNWYEYNGKEKEVIEQVNGLNGEEMFILKGFTDVGFAKKELIFI